MLMIMFFKEKDQEEWERSLFLVYVCDCIQVTIRNPGFVRQRLI